MTKKDTKAIIELETKFWQSMVDKDTDAVVAMLDDKSLVTGAQGTALLSHNDYLGMAKRGESLWNLKSFKLDDVNVTFPTEDVAVIAYKVKWRWRASR